MRRVIGFGMTFGLAACGFAPSAATSDGGAPDTATGDLCAPTTTSCDGPIVRTCGADHHWDPSQDRACQFTCSEGQCVAASNVPLDDVALCTDASAVLAPAPGATVAVSEAGGTHLDCAPNCGINGITRIEMTKSYPGAPGLALFCLAKLVLPAAAQVGIPAGGGPKPAIAFVVDGEVTIDGIFSFDGGSAGSGADGGHAGPGGFDGAPKSDDDGNAGQGPCHGSGGTNSGPTVFGSDWSGGGGGGAGNSTIGGDGGNGSCVDGDHHGRGGTHGELCGTDDLQPLIGGSGGGGGGDATSNGPYGYAGGGGGGALQISGRRTITISGSVSARGGAGYGTNSIDGGGGGGAGGGLLFEAPRVVMIGSLNVDGGPGGIGGPNPGGLGAAVDTLASSGVSYTANGQGGSGGGGGGGRIRIVGGNATCVGGVSPVTSCTIGALPIVTP